MSSHWQLRTLGDCAKWFSGGTPRKSEQKYWGGDIPWLSAKSMQDFYLSDSEDRVTELAIGNGTRLTPKNSILFVVRGMSLKSEFRVGICTRPVAFNQDLKALVPVPDIDPRFLAYAIKAKSDQILSLVEEAGHGTGVLPTPVLQAVEIGVPPLAVQKEVSRICQNIDDKIELNRQMNETLEAMAQALFKSWFVDFDPVIDKALAAGNPIPDPLKAKAARRQALGEQRKRLPQDLQDQFPDRFVYNDEMGWVPEGWGVSTVSGLIHINPRLPLKKGEVATYVDMKAPPHNRLHNRRVDQERVFWWREVPEYGHIAGAHNSLSRKRKDGSCRFS